ncbi:MAG: zinc ribbon domain-containing protein [Opitutaceae bacterium]
MAARSQTPSTPEICPVCGEEVPPGARACPGCGADERTGWGDDDASGSVDLPDDDAFDYDAFVEREFGGGARPPGIRTIWWVTAIVLIIAVGVVFILF